MSSPNDSTPVTQPTIAPDDAIAGTAPDVAGTEVPTTQSQPIAVTRKMSPEEEQYLKAIAMSSAGHHEADRAYRHARRELAVAS